REAGFEGDISLSHRVSGEYREYERTCTTVIDAFVRGRMGSYLSRLESGLGGSGFAGRCMIMRSGGGAMTFAEATERPFETILSGPVAGARALAGLAERLGFGSAVDVARGVVQIVAAQMADAIRSVTVERGRDPREAAVVAFGGAGPLFGTLLADELGARSVVVPPYAGNFSALGLLGADLSRTASRTRVMRLADGGLAAARAIAADLFDELDARASTH